MRYNILFKWSLGFFLVTVVFLNFVFLVRAQEVKIEAKKIVYDLPYAGILPDHPLFFLKDARDRLLEFATRDQLKKAKLYLLFADKRLRMALELGTKGKWGQTADSVTVAETYFLKIPALLVASQKQGAAPEGNFVLKLKTAAAKHREVIESLIKDGTDGSRAKLESALKINQRVNDKLTPF